MKKSIVVIKRIDVLSGGNARTMNIECLNWIQMYLKPKHQSNFSQFLFTEINILTEN